MDLSWWQLQHDYYEPAKKLMDKAKPKGEGLNLMAVSLPSRDVYVANLKAQHPDWPESKIHDQYDEIARQWKAEEEAERKEREAE